MIQLDDYTALKNAGKEDVFFNRLKRSVMLKNMDNPIVKNSMKLLLQEEIETLKDQYFWLMKSNLKLEAENIQNRINIYKQAQNEH